MGLLLVDGSNILLRCSFGGGLPPEVSTPTSIRMIERAAREVGASHLIVAIDHTDTPSWRKLAYPDYKAHRTVSTAPWLIHGAAAMSANGWHVEMVPGFEADDVIATLALRAGARTPVSILSNDSDLLALTAADVVVVRPTTGGFDLMTSTSVCEKYRIPEARLLNDLKAMCGESGDNIPGVPGIGPKRAASLLNKFPGLEAIIAAGAGGYSRDSELVSTHADAARRAMRLVSLRTDVPLRPITPRMCAIAR